MPRIRLADLDLFYEETGAGRTVLFLHGAFSRGIIGFGPQLTAFHRKCRGLFPDLRGHGRTRLAAGKGYPNWTLSSIADDMLLLCDALHLERVHMVGYSMGGAVALYMACRAPERFASLATIGTSGCVSPAVVENAASFDPDCLEREGRTEFIEAVRVNHMQAHGGDWKALVRQTTRSWRNEPQFEDRDLATIAAPCLFMAGSDDELVHREHLEHLAGTVQDGRFLVVEGCGHGAHQQAPELVNGKLVELWTRGDSGG